MVTWYAHASVGTCMCADHDIARGGAHQMSAMARKPVPGAPIKGAFSGEHGDGLCVAGEGSKWQVGKKRNDAFRASSRRWTRSASARTGSSIRRHGRTGKPVSLPPPAAPIPTPWSFANGWEWRVERSETSGERTRLRRRKRGRCGVGLRQGGGDVQQQRPCRKCDSEPCAPAIASP